MIGVQVPSDAYEWMPRNGSLAQVYAYCAKDARCAGFYPCSFPSSPCASLAPPADMMLLAGVPGTAMLEPNVDAVLYAKSAHMT